MRLNRALTILCIINDYAALLWHFIVHRGSPLFSPMAVNMQIGDQGNRPLKRSPLGDLANSMNGLNDLDLKI
jgi:hypothetical protein